MKPMSLHRNQLLKKMNLRAKSDGFIVILFLAALSLCNAQDTLRVDSAGIKLKNFYTGLNVENLWIAGHHINWETGLPNDSGAKEGVRTHCSAFAAAACERLNIYILHPPQHGQVLLANAQFEWLKAGEAYRDGWRQISDTNEYVIYSRAQEYANKGYVVVAVVQNPDEHKPGHIAFILPGDITQEKLKEEGPGVIMASAHNYNYIPLKRGFKSHITGWPEKSILFYYNSNRK
jgi:hypothetical protein